MFVTVVAVLCSLTGPACIEEIVTDSSMDDRVTLQSCLMIGQAPIAKWMSEHPLYRLIGVSIAISARMVIMRFTGAYSDA